MRQANIDQFQSYSQFKSLKDFNNNVEMFLADKKDKLSKGEYIAFRRLTKFMAKVYGVCNAKICTIVAATHEKNDMGGISRSTFKRTVSKLKTMGILSVIQLERKNGSKSSNLYVFNRYACKVQVEHDSKVVSLSKSNEPSKPVKVEPSVTTNLSKTNNINNNKRTTDNLDLTYTSDTVPEAFKSLVACYFDSAKTIEMYWSKVKLSAYKNAYEDDLDLMTDIATHSFKQLIRKIKFSKVRDKFGYFYGILDKQFEKMYFTELFEMGFGA